MKLLKPRFISLLFIQKSPFTKWAGTIIIYYEFFIKIKSITQQ
ncbi:hypothetical protein PCIT_b1010 [Pseudoalteromonas citrea]|uniref:Uncharacterized protein n=1 Tax=Pseudoalteromonas citrea TaxID=43655 RepID=A0AAD4FQ95_9GAMM|nr:hypothetical protein PCIT_b1010 [Pseudoalteromonas citrea]